jgi:hypothetical protein
MPEGTYTPQLDLYGTDTNEALVHRNVTVTDDDRLHVSSLVLNAVVVFADTIGHGDSTSVQMEVKNLGGTQVTIEEAGLTFSPTGGLFDQAITNLPMDIPANGTRNLEGNIRVGVLTPPGEYLIDGFVVGTSPGGGVSDSSANVKDRWVVVSAAVASYLPDSIDPPGVSAGGSYVFQLDLMNEGGSRITLSRGTTRLEIGEGGELINVAMPEDRVMPGDSAVTTIFFNPGTIADTIPPGKYPITLHLDGRTELGGEFQQVLDLPDSLRVESPPDIAVLAESLSKRILSKEYPEALSVGVENRGEATLDLDPNETIIYFGDEDTLFVSSLSGQGNTFIIPGTETTLQFVPAIVPGTLPSGSYPTFIVFNGTHNGVSFADTAQADSVSVVSPARLRVDVIAFPDRVAQGETFSITARVVNEGEADVTTSGILFLDTDSLVTDEATLPFGPNLPDDVTWNVTVPAALSPGVVQLSANISQLPRDENSGLPALVSQETDNFALTVVRRNQLSLVKIDPDGVPPMNVYRGQSNVPMLYLQVRSTGEKEGDIGLNEIRIGLEERGGISIGNPERVLDRIIMTGSGGVILAEVNESQQGQYILSPDSVYSIGGEPDTLQFHVDVSNGADVVTFQLMIDGEDAVEAVDLATDTETGIVEGSEDVPLGILRSDFTVLNLKDFADSFKNFPNPMGSGDGSTTFSYYLPEDADVTISIYTLTGSLVRTLSYAPGANGGRGPGINQVRWGGFNGKGRYVNNGAYFCVATARMSSGQLFNTRYKLAVMR